MTTWLHASGDLEIPQSDDDVVEDDEEIGEKLSELGLSISELRKVFTGNDSWTWLITHLGPSSADVETVSDKIHSQLMDQGLDDPGTSYRILLESQWNPLEFLEQQYPLQEQRLHDVIVLTGDEGRVQATTCYKYLSQKWPTFGPAVLAAIDKCVSSGNAVTGK